MPLDNQYKPKLQCVAKANLQNQIGDDDAIGTQQKCCEDVAAVKCCDVGAARMQQMGSRNAADEDVMLQQLQRNIDLQQEGFGVVTLQQAVSVIEVSKLWRVRWCQGRPIYSIKDHLAGGGVKIQ